MSTNAETPTPAEGDENVEGQDDSVEDISQKARDAIIAQMTDPVERWKAKLCELDKRKESGEIASEDLEWEYLFYLRYVPLWREHLHGKALVLTQDNLEELGALEMTLKSGEITFIEPESLHPDDVLIIYPYEVGTKKDYIDGLLRKISDAIPDPGLKYDAVREFLGEAIKSEDGPVEYFRLFTIGGASKALKGVNVYHDSIDDFEFICKLIQIFQKGGRVS